MPLLARLGLAWIMGISLTYWLNLPWPAIAILALPAVGALFLYRHNPRVQIWVAIALAFLTGAFRFSFFQPTFDETHIAFYNDSPAPVTITGVVADEPDIRDHYINLRLRVESLQASGTANNPKSKTQNPKSVEGLILVRAPRYPERFYGDRLTVTGNLETPPIFKDFSYKDYLARFGIHSMIRRPKIALIESGQGHPFWTALYSFKAQVSATINRILAEPYAALLNGILLGIETGIPRDLYEEFNLTGTSHVIVISGSNIAIIAGVVLLLGQQIVGKRYAPPLAIAGIILYTLLVGADAAVSRAAVMGIVWVLAIWLGRPAFALNALFFSGFVLTLINPLMLWDVGFQLSFMATLGLIIMVPPMERVALSLLQRVLKTEQVGLAMSLLSTLIIVTLAAQIITAPLIVYHFGRLSLVSLLSNLLILPAQPPIMIVGGLAALAGMLWLPLGQLLSWLVWLPLAWTVGVVEQTARWSWASLDLGTFPFWLMMLLYAAIFAGIWWANQPRPTEEARPHFALPQIGSLQTRLMVGCVGVAALLTWLAVLALPDGRLHVAFLDVGQGDAIFITLPDGRQVLIDGGPSATDLNWRLGQEMPFWDRTLDLVINTHPDTDHLGGLVSLPERYTIEQVVVTDVEATSQLYQEWETEITEANLIPTIGQTGMRLSLGQDITATILSPGPALSGIDEPNNRSVVLYLQYGQISFLLPGDIEAEVERRLIQADTPLRATVLKSPHHGSKTSSSPAFLNAVDPRIVVISVGEDNRFGHPSPEVLERYAARGLTALRTDERGTIEFSTDGVRLWVETTR